MLLYICITTLLFFILLPYFHIRFKGKELKHRLGSVDIGFDSSIWIHAASVGEVNAIKPLLNKLLNKYPEKHFVLSTVTKTGRDIANKISPKLKTFFFPLDVNFIMKRAFNSINPELIILMETELWPNMLRIARKRKIPVLIVNGRISNKSFPKYRRLLFFWKSLWKPVVAVNAQSDLNADRFNLLGFKNVLNTHNLKFCLELPEYEKSKLRKEMGYSKDDFIVVWGSSRPGEEKLLKSIIWDLEKEIPALQVVIVPRHLSRLSEIKDIFKDFDYKLYSENNKQSKIILVDEMNILNLFYALTDIAIVGGSFFNFGGHNPLEPAYYGVPTIMGEYFQSCSDTVNKLKKNKAILISSKDKLKDNILKLYKNKNFAEMLGQNAKNTIKQNSESLKNNLKILEQYIQ